MTSFECHIQTAEGFLILGLPLDANQELESIEAAQRARPEVLRIRLRIYETLGKWDLMEVAANALCHLEPENPEWPIGLAHALRRARRIDRAVDVLTDAIQRFPEEGMIYYHLACCEAQSGNLAQAHTRLVEAGKFTAGIGAMAWLEPDLKPYRLMVCPDRKE